MTELECVSGQTTVIKTQKTELNRTIEELEAALRAKEEVQRRSGEGSGGQAKGQTLSKFCLFRSWRD